MEDIIKGILGEKRYIHSVGVAETARKIAKGLCTDSEKAYLAGLVHDIAKEMKGEELLTYCREHSIELNSVESKNLQLLHGPVGAEMIKDYDITDFDIVNAVRYHTVGRAGMSVLEKIIYLADMIEPSRQYEGVEKLRNLCREDFDKAFAEALRQSLIWNLEKGRLIHTGTLDAWNDVIGGN